MRPAKVMWHLFLFIVLIFFSCSSTSPIAAKDWSKKLHILFIGNSLTYTNDLPGLLERMLKNTNIEDLLIESEVHGNFGLQDHWDRKIALDKISEGNWDIVVLQQGPSATEGRPSLLEYSQKFASKIKKTGGTTALYMVWPSEVRFFDFDGVSDSYKTAAELVKGILFPVGEAWRLAWSKDEDLELYSVDNFHPSLIGSYLAALVMFDQLTKINLHDLPASIPTANGSIKISEDLSKLLQESAIEANLQFAR